MSWFFGSDGGKLDGVIGGGASVRPLTDKETGEIIGSQKVVEAVTGSYGIVSRSFRALGANFDVQLGRA